MCVSAVQVLFLWYQILCDIMVKCTNDCCHLEVADTVNSMQYILYSTITKYTHFLIKQFQFVSHLKPMQIQPKVSSVMVLWQNAYYVCKKVQSCGIIEAIVSKTKGGCELQRQISLCKCIVVILHPGQGSWTQWKTLAGVKHII